MGGSGDVLAGCTGGLLARMLSAVMQSHHAAQQNSIAATDISQPVRLQPAHTLAGQAVALHALAGKSLAEQWPLRGNTPSDVADALPRTLSAYAAAAPAQAAPRIHTRDPKDDILPWPR